MPDGSLFFVWRMRARGKNVESLRGRDESLLFFYHLFPYLFLHSIAGVTSLRMGEVFQRLELEFSFEEWRAGTVGWSLESAFSAVDMLVSTT